MTDPTSPSLIKKLLVCLFCPPWRTWKTNVVTVLVATISGPIFYIWIGIFGIFFRTEPPPRLVDLPHFTGTLLADADPSDGLNHFSGPGVNLVLKCTYPYRRFHGRQCLPPAAIGEDDLLVSYWPEHSLLMNVSSVGKGKSYLRYDDQAQDVKKFNELSTPSGMPLIIMIKYIVDPKYKFFRKFAFMLLISPNIFGIILLMISRYHDYRFYYSKIGMFTIK